MNRIFLLICLSILLSSGMNLRADILPVVKLSGYWKFNIGDNPDWSKKDFNDSQWDEIRVPWHWEDQGYVEYDGYAWYRQSFEVPQGLQNTQLYLFVDRIDDVSQVYFNGKLIGQAGLFPPRYKTGYNLSSTYPVPEELINFNGPNTIAVRVFDEGREGGFVGQKVVLGYERDNILLSQDLSGQWKFNIYYNRSCINPEFDDSDWDNIHVPATWESQGYKDFDGQACYRKKFKLNSKLIGEKLYLVCGIIDDEDQILLNGQLIGVTEDMYKTNLGDSFVGHWQIRRAYKIPDGLLNDSGINTLVVLVDDYGESGGIYEGPVGLMTRDQYRRYEDRHELEEWFPGHHFIKSLWFD